MIQARIKTSEGDKTYRFTSIGGTGQILHRKFNQDKLVKIKLHGELARVCGRGRFDLAVTSVREALSAIHHLTKQKSTKLFVDLHDMVRWNVQVNGQPLDGADPDVGDLMCVERELETIEIYPVMQGAGNWIGALLGALLIVVGIVLIVVTGGIGAAGAGFLGMLGLELVIGGVATLLGGLITLFSSPTQQSSPGTKANKAATGLPSYLFSGSINVVDQGGPVPLCYGKVICGSQLIAATITSTSVVYVGAPPAVSGNATGSANPPQVTPTAADIIPIEITPLMQDYMDLLGLTEWPDGSDVLTAQPGSSDDAPKYAIKHWDGSFGLIYSKDPTEVNPFHQMISENIVVSSAVDDAILNYINPNSGITNFTIPDLPPAVVQTGQKDLGGAGWFYLINRASLSTVNRLRNTQKFRANIFPTLGPWKNFKVVATAKAKITANLH